MADTTNLVLGGHSFISQLGTDPAPTADEAARLVAACLDAGITRFDTTYAPERVALGKALATIRRRDEAFVIAWNFFTHFGPEESVGGHEPYQPRHLQQMLDELQTDWIDLLVVHPLNDPSDQAKQQELAIEWLQQGRVRQLGTWDPSPTTSKAPYAAAIAPYNVITPKAAEDFESYKARGWQTYATSPFVRGWELDKRVEQTGRTKKDLADEMLRYSAFAPNVDFLIVAMRKLEWIHTNVESWRKGPLDDMPR